MQIRIYFILVIFGLLHGCGIGDPADKEAEVIRDGDRILIKDRTGKQWDVTHAVRAYGFRASEFQYGLGPDAIKPIIEPDMLNPGDPQYPDGQDDRLIIGTKINEETRAYPLAVLTSHEIVDDIIGGAHVAVAY